MNTDISFSIVIPNYNGLALLQKNLPLTIAAAQATGKPFEIIIADDASTDGSIAYIESHYPQIIIVKNKQNLGFAGNINSGIMLAQKSWVLALNSDISLHPNYLCQLMPHLSVPHLFGLMGGIYDNDTKKIIDAAKYPAINASNINGTINYKSTNPHQLLPTLFLSGANALINTKLLQQLGGFDTLYTPYYFEDVDLGLKAWRSGLTCYYAPQAICWHATSSTINKEPNEKVKAMVLKNKLILHAVHLQGIGLLAWHMLLFIKKLKCLFTSHTPMHTAIDVYSESITQIIKRRQQMQQNKYIQVSAVKAKIFALLGSTQVEKF